MKLILTNKIQEAVEVWSFTFEFERPIQWRAGQFLEYTLPHKNEDDRGEKRWFTISSSPSEKHIMLTTRFAEEKGSSFKGALNELEIGSTIEANGPDGDFVYEQPERDHLFVAGGIGVTPFRSIFVELKNTKRPINGLLHYGNKSADNVPFKRLLDDIAHDDPTFKIEYVLDPERITAERIIESSKKLRTPLVYLSGPEAMIESLEKELKELGINEKDLKRDYFPGYDLY